MKTIQDVLDHTEHVLYSFKQDPADTDYQRGYEAAYKELQKHLLL